MATIKEHQAAMVDLLANGSGIPASASRLAHAMHDVLAIVNNLPFVRPVVECGEGGLPERPFLKRNDATTPGLNDKALSKREKALKTDSPAKWPTPDAKAPVSAEQRVMQLENTVGQLRKQSAQYRATIAGQKEHIEHLQFELEKLRTAEERLGRGLRGVIEHQEQSGCRKPDTQWSGNTGGAGHGLPDDGIDPVRSK